MLTHLPNCSFHQNLAFHLCNLYITYYAGMKTGEVKHDKFTDIKGDDDIIGMCIASGGRVLWASAAETGLLNFDVN